jgi:hypothetical protein
MTLSGLGIKCDGEKRASSVAFAIVTEGASSGEKVPNFEAERAKGMSGSGPAVDKETLDLASNRAWGSLHLACWARGGKEPKASTRCYGWVRQATSGAWKEVERPEKNVLDTMVRLR